MSQDLNVGILLAVSMEILRSKTLMHLTVSLPNNQFDFSLPCHMQSQKLVGSEDDPLTPERFHHLEGIGRGAANIALSLHRG